MAKSIWGLDFGNWSLKVVRGEHDRKSGAITVNLFDQFIYGDLPCGYEATPLEKHREGVIAFQNKYEVEPGDDLCVAVTGSEVFSRFINLPPVPENLDRIIRYEARQQIPFDMEDVVWDYQPVKEEHEVGEEIEVGLFALKRETVAELLDLLAPWRQNLRIVQNAPLAVYNFLNYEGLGDEPCVVLDIGATTTDVLVLNPPRFWVRTLLVAGNDLTSALKQNLGINTEEAEKIKSRVGRSRHRDQILRTLQPVFEDITNEVQRSLGYYKSIAREVRFGTLRVTGNAIRLSGMQNLLAGGLQYEVEPLQQLRRVQLASGVDRNAFQQALPGLGAAIGLVVQGAGQARVRINMVPEEIVVAGEMAQKKRWLVGAAAALVVAVGGLMLGEYLYASELDSIQATLNSPEVEQADQYRQRYDRLMNEVRQVRETLVSLAGGEVSEELYMTVLSAVSENLPQNVYLRDFALQWEGEGATVEGKDLVVHFQAESNQLRGGEEHIEQALEALRAVTDRETGQPIFSEVERIGELVNVWRNGATGVQVPEPSRGGGGSSAEVMGFIAFEVRAVVNTGADEAPQQAGN